MPEGSSSPGSDPLREFRLDVGHWIDIPEDHATLYANWVQIMGTSTETFVDFFLVDAHPKGEAGGDVEARKHFLARIVVNNETRKSLLELLAATVEHRGHLAN